MAKPILVMMIILLIISLGLHNVVQSKLYTCKFFTTSLEFFISVFADVDSFGISFG